MKIWLFTLILEGLLQIFRYDSGEGRFCLYVEKLRSAGETARGGEARQASTVLIQRIDYGGKGAKRDKEETGSSFRRCLESGRWRRDETLPLAEERPTLRTNAPVQGCTNFYARTLGDAWLHSGGNSALLSPSAWILKHKVLIWSSSTTVFI